MQARLLCGPKPIPRSILTIRGSPPNRLTGNGSAPCEKEASVIRDMSPLPEQEQLRFWHEEFLPLLVQEHALREQLLLAGQRMSRGQRCSETRRT
jgi:hypothetical protein